MDRVLVLGRGGAGKSVLARRVAAALDAPVVELDTLFWTAPDLRPLPRAEWVRRQHAALPARSRGVTHPAPVIVRTGTWPPYVALMSQF